MEPYCAPKTSLRAPSIISTQSSMFKKFCHGSLEPSPLKRILSNKHPWMPMFQRLMWGNHASNTGHRSVCGMLSIRIAGIDLLRRVPFQRCLGRPRWWHLLGASRAFEPCRRLQRSRFVLWTGGFMGQWLEMDGKEWGGGYLVVQMFNVLFTESISRAWYSCIAPWIYPSVVQQKDHNRQRKHIPLF